MALRPSPDRHVKDDYPWWLVALVAIGIVLAVVIITNAVSYTHLTLPTIYSV